MNEFPYENLDDTEFEELVIRICKEILGIGCKTFSVGKDGAKDSWFQGTAQYFPSSASPWSGTFNIQAKHTKIHNASCSDNDFSVNKTSVLVRELERLKELRNENAFNNYILFTNRKLPGGAYPSIVKMMQDGIGISSTEIIGREQLNTYLTDFPHIADQFGLYKFMAPLRFYEKELKEVIVFFAQNSKTLSADTSEYVRSFSVIGKERKNELNNLSESYFEFIKSHSLQYFEEIERFLKDPKNEKFTKMYANTVSDLQDAITIERSRFNEFEHVIKHIVDYVVGSNEDRLLELRRIVRVFVHFMYFNCDIGVTK